MTSEPCPTTIQQARADIRMWHWCRAGLPMPDQILDCSTEQWASGRALIIFQSQPTVINISTKLNILDFQ